MRSKLDLGLISLLSLAAAVACSTPAPQTGDAGKSQAGQVKSATQSVPGQASLGGQRFKVAYRRLTESQYRHTIADTFGPDVTINARFEPEQRQDGLQAIGNAQLSITTTGLEQYIVVARAVADQVVDGKQRDAVIGCAASGPDSDLGCASQFIKRVGAQLFRRPLTQPEVDLRVGIFKDAVATSKDFHKAIKLSLVSLLVAPEFLFRVEQAEADAGSPGGYRLDSYTKAQRLSFLLWDSAPDAELMEAARSGAIHSPDVLRRQTDRLLASPRLADGVRAFFADMLHFDGFDTLTKDPSTYPLFSQAMADAAREETLRGLVDHLIVRGGDYRDIFVTRDTFINRTLAAVYNVPYPTSEKWARITFQEESERSGVLTHASLLSLFAHPASSSPTVRGVNLNDIFLCLPTPTPPPNVDFSKVQATANGTVRSRLIDHMTNPGCSTCHMISDPVGLSLERFDGIGQHRVLENNQPIDVSVELAAVRYVGAQGLGRYLHDNPDAPSCLVRNVYYYSQGRPQDFKESAYLDAQTAGFAKAGYKLPDLYRAMIASPEFFKVVRPAAPLQASAPSAIPPSSQGE